VRVNKIKNKTKQKIRTHLATAAIRATVGWLHFVKIKEIKTKHI